MVKILSTSSNDLFCNSEQYNNCSSFLMKADDPPLEDLDPAILSCGLPAIMLSDMQPFLATARSIRYTIGQLQGMRKSSLCFRRPAAVDDPRIAHFTIWRTPNTQQKRTSSTQYATTSQAASRRDDNRSDEMSNHHTNKPRNQERSAAGQKYHYGRENGFVAPRFRRNYEFSNRSHHVIVKSYRGSDEYRLQDTVIEEEPEWVAAGPTSRLDTIELRGFDEDVSLHALSTSQSSLEKANSDTKNSGNSSTEKHISFYDELHHYEHVHPKRGNNLVVKQHDSSGRENDVESVAASNTSSPPPARSTPTKNMYDYNNNLANDAHQKFHHQSQHNGVNVHNFEEFMKFDSFLGADSASGNNNQSGSRFSKWFRRGANQFSQTVGSNYDGRRQSYNSNNDSFGHGYGGGNRYQYDRNQQQQQQRYSGASYNRGFLPDSYEQPNYLPADSSAAFKRLVDMVAQNRANNNLIAQQQYLMQLLSKNQQSEILRRMLMKNAVDNVADSNQQQQQQPPPQQPRIPTQRELQFHTQSIMQNALLRKKLQDQRKVLFEQNSQMAAVAAVAGSVEPNPAVQQFVQSVCPNIQRSLSVLSQTATANSQCHQFNQSFPGGGSNNQLFTGGPTHHELSASLQQMLLPQQQGQRTVGSNRRFGKGSVTWNHGN